MDFESIIMGIQEWMLKNFNVDIFGNGDLILIVGCHFFSYEILTILTDYVGVKLVLAVR